MNHITITGECPKLEGQGLLSFEISVVGGCFCLRVTDNAGPVMPRGEGGGEWPGTHMSDPTPIHELFKRVESKRDFQLKEWDHLPGDNNNPGFVCAVLVHIGIVEKLESRGHYAFVKDVATGTVIFEGRAGGAAVRLNFEDASSHTRSSAAVRT